MDNLINLLRMETQLLAIGTFGFQWMLLIGCGLLAAALLILTLTRWGQVRPIWKCVVLSVVAHLLLVGYMYGTHLISRAPVVKRADTVQMRVLADEPELREIEPPQIEESEPEERFADAEFLPELEPLSRPEIDSVVEIEEGISEQMGKAFENVGLSAEQSPFQMQPAVIEPDGLQATPISRESALPEEIEFQRREPEDVEPSELPMLDEGGDFEVPRVEPELEENPFQPIQVEDKAEPAEIDQFQPIDSGDFNPEPSTEQPKFSAERSVIENTPETEMVPVERLRRASDNAPMPTLYSLRSDNRSAVAAKRGGTTESENAVNDALAWLAANQSADGRWDSEQHGGGIETRALGHNRDRAGVNADTGVTALALLAFMAAGNTHYDGEYQENVQHGLEFLIRSQKANGLLDGEAKLFARMYCHSMALLALSEAIAVTGDSRLKSAVEKGVEYTVRAQNRTDGGWRYQPGDAGDMSQFGWKVLALHSASLGGVATPERTVSGMRSFLASCTSGQANGLGSYRPKEKVSSTMTAEALVCRYFLQPDVSVNTIDEAATRIRLELPNERDVNLYYWYYGTMAMYHTGGEAWREWNEALQNVLLGKQIQFGIQKGSWEPDGVWGGYGGRVYSTALAALCLEVYYRHLPIYEARLR
jgi:hypothetical protein